MPISGYQGNAKPIIILYNSNIARKSRLIWYTDQLQKVMWLIYWRITKGQSLLVWSPADWALWSLWVQFLGLGPLIPAPGQNKTFNKRGSFESEQNSLVNICDLFHLLWKAWLHCLQLSGLETILWSIGSKHMGHSLAFTSSMAILLTSKSTQPSLAGSQSLDKSSAVCWSNWG